MLGLNDQIQTNSGSNAGVGFAIPSNTVARIANQIIAGHSVKHSYVGVELNGNSSGGAQVTTVQPGSPAVSAGIKAGDVITAINGKPITTTEAFIATVDNYAPGDTITLTVKRGGQSQNDHAEARDSAEHDSEQRLGLREAPARPAPRADTDAARGASYVPGALRASRAGGFGEPAAAPRHGPPEEPER